MAGASLGVAAAAWAATGTSGNARAIAIARAEARAFTRIPAATYTQSGLIEMNDAEGRTSYFNFSYGLPTLRRGWTWATEHGVMALRHGRVVWWRDDLVPPPCRRTGICHQIPVELVSERSGAYWAFGNAARHTCFGRLHGTQPVTVDAVAQRVYGHFLAPVFGRGTVQLTYTYPFGPGRTARETDTLNARTYLVRSGRITGGHTIRFSEGYPRRAPRAPHVNLCRG